MQASEAQAMGRSIDILVSEVGPRDGLQNVRRIMPAAARTDWIRALAAAGLREIEIGSFVDPRRLPQMAETGEVAVGLRDLQGVRLLALAPNLKGAQRAFEAGLRKITVPLSVSALHARANVNMTPEEIVAQIAAICALRDARAADPASGRAGVEVGLSTAFGCTMEGPVPEDRVIRLAVMAAQAGADSVCLADTAGTGHPAQVRRLFRRLRTELGDKAGGAHFHNTRGQGLANVVAALDAGVTTFDSSQGGLGGCPYAPGASGNIVTEDLVYLLEAMGLRTGIDIEALIAARAHLAVALPGEPLHGHVPEAGLPRGFPRSGEAPP